MAEPVNAQMLAVYIHEINANYYVSLIAFVIIYYDYLLTFGEEVRFFWRRRPSSATALFFVNRYLSIAGNVPVILQSFRSWGGDGCSTLQKFHQFFSVFVQVIVGIIMILRTYALFERNTRIGTIMALFACIVIGVGVWAILGKTTPVDAPTDSSFSFMLGCHPLISKPDGIRLAFAWGGLLLFDSVIFSLTLYRAIGIWRLGTRRLYHVLVRDGTMYYLVLAMANLSNILTFVLGDPLLRGISTTFANAISVTLVNRLMLNLQNPALFEYNTRSQYTGSLSSGTHFVVGVPSAFEKNRTEDTRLDFDPAAIESGTDSHGTRTSGMLSSTISGSGSVGLTSTSSYTNAASSVAMAVSSGLSKSGRTLATPVTSIAKRDGANVITVKDFADDVDADAVNARYDHDRDRDREHNHDLSYDGDDDEDEGDWDLRLPRRALWYNPDWVSGARPARPTEAGLRPKADGAAIAREATHDVNIVIEMSPISRQRLRSSGGVSRDAVT